MSWADVGDARQNNLDTIRLLLAVLVIWSHSYPLTSTFTPSDLLGTVSGGQLNGGELAVNGFFTISGFLIAQSWTRSSSAKAYFTKRVLRIHPGYLTAMIVTAAVFTPLGSDPWSAAFRPRTLSKVALCSAVLTFYPARPWIFPRNPYPGVVNGSMWTIQFEFLCYVMLAIAGTAGLLTRRWAMTIVVIGLIVLDVWCGRYPPVPLNNWWWAAGRGWAAIVLGPADSWPRLMAQFWVGMTFYAWRNSIPHRPWLAAASVGAIAVALAIRTADAVMPVAGTYLLFWLAFETRLRLPQAARYGDFSYGTYLYGFPIQQLIVSRLPGIGPTLLFAITAPLSIAAGAASWYSVERRFLTSRWSGRKSYAAPVRVP